jgi:CheY-like chemotaxis protein
LHDLLLSAWSSPSGITLQHHGCPVSWIQLESRRRLRRAPHATLNKTGHSALFLLPDYPEVGGRCAYGQEMVASRSMAPIVLVVEDKALIRTYIADTLTRAGYVVLQAPNADEAIRIMEHRSDVSVVFTDVEMPGSIDGLKLAHYVAKRWPPVRLLVTSGHRQLDPPDLPSGARFFCKPVSPAAMTAAIAELLGEAPPEQPVH